MMRLGSLAFAAVCLVWLGSTGACAATAGSQLESDDDNGSGNGSNASSASGNGNAGSDKGAAAMTTKGPCGERPESPVACDGADLPVTVDGCEQTLLLGQPAT